MHRQCFFQPFLQAPRRARIDSFQLPEDFLQRLFGLRVVVHRIRVAHSSIVVFLAVLGQVLLHIPPLVNLAALHFHLFTENMFHTGDAGSAARLARSALPPELASPPTPRLSATAPAPATLALRPPRTCDWTCGLSSGICFSRRLSPLKRDSQPEL